LDERAHLQSLIFPGFVTATDASQLANLPRYLHAIRQRLTDAPANPARDAERRAVVALVEQDLAELRARTGERTDPQALDQVRWLIEELRVSLFAQRLGTAQPVSVKRIHAAMDDLDPR
jgi:ATP-dependent helicase HrpA